MERQEFINYLRDTLIPDLRESGSSATADDFETAAHFIDNPDSDEYPPCPKCGNPIDYCQGHGEIG